MKDLVDTTEMYLRTIYDLEEEGVVPLRRASPNASSRAGRPSARPLRGWSATVSCVSPAIGICS